MKIPYKQFRAIARIPGEFWIKDENTDPGKKLVVRIIDIDTAEDSMDLELVGQATRRIRCAKQGDEYQLRVITPSGSPHIIKVVVERIHIFGTTAHCFFLITHATHCGNDDKTMHIEEV